MLKHFRIASLCGLILAITAGAHAQGGNPTRTQQTVGSQLSARTVPAAVASNCSAGTPNNLTVTYVGAKQIDVYWNAPTVRAGCTLVDYLVKANDDTIATTGCGVKPDHIDETKYNFTELCSYNYYTLSVIAEYSEGSSDEVTVNASTTLFGCLALPLRFSCINNGPSEDLEQNRQNNINQYFQTNGSFTYFNQIRSIYNSASGSVTVSADMASLNFGNGMQLTVSTNVQAGSSGAAPISSGTLPTLSSNGAGQAAQNMLFGGTFQVAELYPLLSYGSYTLGNPGGFGVVADFVAKEGVDIQNFTPKTNLNLSSPPFHGSGQVEAYLQYNSINADTKSTNQSTSPAPFVGSIFAGGTYGYSYTSPGYLRDYGFASKQNSGIGQISAGVLISNVVKIVVSRGFGPSQTYTDSTTMVETRVNNFKIWSIGITYQSPPPKPTAPASAP
jgi:hypothetical protein